MDLGLKRLPWYGQIGLFVGLAGIATAAFYNFYASPLQVEMTLQREKLETLRRDINRGLQIMRKGQETKKEIDDLEAKLKSLQAVLPEEKDQADLVKRIDMLARQSNLRVMSIKPAPQVPKPGYIELPFNMMIEGNYHNLASFFDRVSKFQRIINIGNIRIKAREKPDATSTIEAECTGMTFVLAPTPAPGTPAAPGAPKAAN